MYRGDARNSVGFNVGYFVVNGEDARVDDDVLLADLDDLGLRDRRLQRLDVRRRMALRGRRLLETGVGVGYYQKTVPSVYRDFVRRQRHRDRRRT